MNHVILSGYVNTRSKKEETIELKGTIDGKVDKRVCNFQLAYADGKDENGKTIYSYATCVAFGKVAENIANSLGDFITIEGSFNVPRPYIDKNGEKVYPGAGIRVNYAEGTNKGNSNAKEKTSASPKQSVAPIAQFDDDEDDDY